MQHSSAPKPATRPVVIEVGGEPQGVVVPSGEAFRFVAVRLPVFPIDGNLYATVEAAQIAARQAIEHADTL